jgi:hypothetical protein
MDFLTFRSNACTDVKDAYQKSHANRDALPEILQHYLIPLIYAAGAGWGLEYDPSDKRFAQIYRAPINPPEFKNYVPSKLVDVSPDTKSDIYPFWFSFPSNDPVMKLPKETQLSFVVEDSNEHARAYIARLEREGYYRLDIPIYPYGSPKKGAFPQMYAIPDGFDAALVTTYRFVVRMNWVLQRTHSYFVVDDYERWAKELFSNIEEKLEN